jgi:hypothetical protein
LIRKIFQKVRSYEKAYREGAVTSEIDKYVEEFKSHRVIRNMESIPTTMYIENNVHTNFTGEDTIGDERDI